MVLSGIADADEAVLLANRRAGAQIVYPALAALFGPGANGDVSVNADLTWRSGGDGCVAATSDYLKMDGTVDGECLVECAFDRIVRAARSEGKRSHEDGGEGD